MSKKIISLFSLLLSCLCLNCQADQFEIANLQEAQTLFWQKLYPAGGWTLYCGEKFNSDHGNVQIHAVYAIEWVIEHMDCGNLSDCRKSSARFNRIEADLHNLYPVLPLTGNARKDYHFGTVDGEYRDFFECDFEVDGAKKTVEPRATALGNIARAIFYMIEEYNLPLSDERRKQLLQWHKEDPPSEDEIRRNELIETVQGTRNHFIDDPSRADDLAK